MTIAQNGSQIETKKARPRKLTQIRNFSPIAQVTKIKRTVQIAIAN